MSWPSGHFGGHHPSYVLPRRSSCAAILPTRDIRVLFLKKALMSRGRKTSFTIRLTPAQRLTLLVWRRATTIPVGQARRARLLLLLADGMTITAAAATAGVSRRCVYKWIQRFLQQGLEGLQDKRRR